MFYKGRAKNQDDIDEENRLFEKAEEERIEAIRAKIDAANKAKFFQISYEERMRREALWDAVTAKRLAQQALA